MGILFANNASSTLAAGIVAGDVTLSVVDASKFPQPLLASDFFFATLVDAAETVWEVVKVTGRSGNSLTVARGQDGTTPQSWAQGSAIQLRVNKGALDAVSNGQGLALGTWQNYTPTWSTDGTQPNIGNGSVLGSWRRVGDSIEIQGYIIPGTTTTFGTGTWKFSLPPGFSIDATKNAQSYGNCFVWNNPAAASSISGSVKAYDSTSLRFLINNGNITNANPLTWSASSSNTLEFRCVLPISGLGSNINLTSDFQEFGANTNTTTSDDTTSFSNDSVGAVFPSYSGSGYSYLTKRVRFQNQIRSTDLLVFEVNNGTGWLSGFFAPISDATTGYGVLLSPVNSTDVDVRIRVKPNAAEAWSAYSSWKWRVRKVSQGNFAQALPDIFQTSEVVTGKTWTNGKPIYRTGVSLGALPNATTKSVAHGVVGATLYTSLSGFAYTAGNTSMLPLPFGTPAALNQCIALDLNGANIEVISGVDRSSYTGIAFLEYTK